MKSKKLIVIGASTGGTDALKDILSELPPTTPPILVAQHILPRYTKGLARILDSLSALDVQEAVDGAKLVNGTVYISPGDKHISIQYIGGQLCVKLMDTEPVNLHKPSVEVLFSEAARLKDVQVMAIILTGMGKDGANAFPLLAQYGAHTIAQDEASSVVFGMPKAAIATGAVRDILDLKGIVNAIKLF